jgi:hypothetical protein
VGLESSQLRFRLPVHFGLGSYAANVGPMVMRENTLSLIDSPALPFRWELKNERAVGFCEISNASSRFLVEALGDLGLQDRQAIPP